MTVRGERLPTIPTMLAVVDTAARSSINQARTLGVPVVRAALPARSGRARRGTTGRVSRTATGYRFTIAPTSRVRYPNGVSAAEVVRWLHTGTGVFGPLGRPIRPRKANVFKLGNGWMSETVKGQAGHDYYGAGRRRADPIVAAVLRRGAQTAALAVARLI